jgi:hypothetical protein
VLLETLVNDAAPAYPTSLLSTKNELLRVTVTVTVRGAGRDEVTFALGELDPGFGNHPALLALTQDGRPIPRGPELVVPGDRAPVEVIDGRHVVTLSAAQLARLPAETLAASLRDPAALDVSGVVDVYLGTAPAH